MSKKNSKARKALKRIYGNGCFVERAGIRKITGYKKDAHMITYHHLRHQSEGGKATVENGANVALENHEWLHTLPREEEEKVNDAIREWKANFLTMKGNGKIEDSKQLTFPDLTKEEDCIIIKAYDTTKEQYEELQKQKQERERKQRFNRSKEKQKLQQLIDELIDEGEIEL